MKRKKTDLAVQNETIPFLSQMRSCSFNSSRRFWTMRRSSERALLTIVERSDSTDGAGTAIAPALLQVLLCARLDGIWSKGGETASPTSWDNDLLRWLSGRSWEAVPYSSSVGGMDVIKSYVQRVVRKRPCRREDPATKIWNVTIQWREVQDILIGIHSVPKLN